LKSRKMTKFRDTFYVNFVYKHQVHFRLLIFQFYFVFFAKKSGYHLSNNETTSDVTGFFVVHLAILEFLVSYNMQNKYIFPKRVLFVLHNVINRAIGWANIFTPRKFCLLYNFVIFRPFFFSDHDFFPSNQLLWCLGWVKN